MRNEREAHLAARWASGAWRGASLRAETGEAFVLLYQGRPGGSVGPDFRDAVLARSDGATLCGDIELHLRPSGWSAHGHADDPRYNAVVLHVVRARTPAGGAETQLANGTLVPLVVLDEPQTGPSPVTPWPCEQTRHWLTPAHLTELLQFAGIERFEERADAFADTLRFGNARSNLRSDETPVTGMHWSTTDRVLFEALAEGLGYGRDRAALRAVGAALARGAVPQAAALCARLPALEHKRTRGLRAWFASWRADGPWAALRPALDAASAPRQVCAALTATLALPEGVVSPGRARILLANVVLPFARAWGQVHAHPAVVDAASAAYLALPGLPANQITRAMSQQLGLARNPPGAAAQQGLHAIWAGFCREKRCSLCPCNLVRALGEEHAE